MVACPGKGIHALRVGTLILYSIGQPCLSICSSRKDPLLQLNCFTFISSVVLVALLSLHLENVGVVFLSVVRDQVVPHLGLLLIEGFLLLLRLIDQLVKCLEFAGIFQRLLPTFPLFLFLKRVCDARPDLIVNDLFDVRIVESVVGVAEVLRHISKVLLVIVVDAQRDRPSMVLS